VASIPLRRVRRGIIEPLLREGNKTMRDNIFGWSYPPGCSGPPEDEPVHPVIDELYDVMYDKVDDFIIDQVVEIVNKLIDDYERKLWKAEVLSTPDESIMDDYLDTYSDRFR
jgi:hypothetical protein